jgi:tRNA-dihydrouridine synthase
MIGRKAIGNPNIFNEFSDKKTNFTFEDYLALSKKYDFPFRQLKFQAMNFTKGKDNATDLRLEISKIKTLKELKEFIVREDI